MINIGSVFYEKGEELGTLNAKWCHSELGVGTGIARGGPIEGYVGNYQIIYCDDDGNEIVKRELVIERTKNYFELTWQKNGVATAKEVAVETINGLSTGWINCRDSSRIKHYSPFQLYRKFKVMCFEIGNFSYT